MKKLYLIPILMILIWVMFINNTYATLTISDEPLSQEPAYTYLDNDIYCIEMGNEISSSYVEPGTISYTYQSDSKNIALYSTVGEYSLPVELAYVLTSNATLQQKQYAIWYSSMNEGNKLLGDPGNTNLVDLPGYDYILEIDTDMNLKEEQMSQDTLNKNKLVTIKNNIVMENTNIEAIIKNIKVQRDTWKEEGKDELEPDTTYLQKAYEDNEKEIKELEKNNSSSIEIEELKTLNKEIKKVIDSKSYDDYIAFLEKIIKENKEAITKLETEISKYQKNIDDYEKTIKELKKQKSEEEVKLKDEYDDLYSYAGELLEDGKIYKNFYENLQKEGGYNPKATKYETKLVKKSNNKYLAGPFELEYPEGGTDDVNFSYIENMYLVDQSGDKIDNIRIVNCEEYDESGNYPASDAKFYIEFTAKERQILEDERTSSSTWREGNYSYTEKTNEKTYSVKLKVEFKYLKSCTGKYSRIEGQGDKITWTMEYSPLGFPYWVAEKAGTYEAQTLIAVNRGKEIFNPDESNPDESNLYIAPTRIWDTEKITVYANGYDEDTDINKRPISTHTPTNPPTNTPTHTPTNLPTNTPTYTPTNPPTNTPTHTPTNPPTNTPTHTPTNTPTNPPTPTPTPEPIKLTMEIAGYVFEDIAANKGNEVNGLLEYNSNDRLLEGIEVAIYEENGDLVRLIQEYEENPEVSEENAEIRTNPTITDRNGYYEFKGLDPQKKYYVEFRYNGLTYEATTYKASVGNSDGKAYGGEAWKINSKAVETIDNRIKVNNIYGEITSYPNNYKKAYDIGLGVGEYNKTYLQSDLVNNYIYSWDAESVNIYTLITRYIQKYINDNKKYPDILVVYKNIYHDQIAHDSEIANKLQFIEDSKISAYTSANGDTKDLYPIYEEFAVEEEAIKIDKTYEPIYEGQQYINFGIKAREEFDLSLAKDVYKAEVHINGKVHKYTYNNVEIDYTDESWNAYVKGSDVGYDRNIYAADYLAKDLGVNELDVYVTYRIALRNQTSLIMAGVTKIADYYDEEYTYVGNATANNYTGTNNGLAYVGNSKGEFVANVIWQDGVKNGEYKTGYITFQNGELNLKNNEDKFVYVAFKVNTANNGLLISDGEIKEDGTIVKQAVEAKQNIVEILGYKTYYETDKTFSNGKTIEAGSIAGVIDRDSMVGNLNPNNIDEINKEDDSDKASGFSLLVDWSNFRSLSGNVWEEIPTESSLNEGTRLGNGEKDSNEANIKNVTVKLLIDGTEQIAKGYVKQPDGTYTWEELKTVTDENGNYSFTGYIPGDYKLRFTYGNVSEDGSGILTDEMKKYNSQDYKSTIYNNDATVTTDRIYWYSIDSDKLKSDAKDSWVRRQDVNNYSIELNNEKSNILKKDSVEYMLKSEKTWMTSETDKLVLEVEYARPGTASVINSIDNHIYKVQNVDLGLVERPRSQLLVEKDVANVKLTLSNNQGEFDAIINSNGEIEVVNDNIGIIKRMPKTYDIKTTPARFDVGKNGQITMNIDEELMQGAELNITYKVTVKNIGEIDYITPEFYYNGIKGTDDKIAKTSATTIVDYVSTNLKTSKVSADWAIVDSSVVKDMVEFISTDEALSNEEYTLQVLDKYNDILKTNALGNALKPGEEATINLLLTETLSPDNDEDDLRYDNILDLVESKNEVGRRHELSIIGNQDPTKEVAELDSGKAETVLIIPPFGMNDDIVLQISIAIIIIAGFGIGVYYIKKRVLK